MQILKGWTVAKTVKTVAIGTKAIAVRADVTAALNWNQGLVRKDVNKIRLPGYVRSCTLFDLMVV